ncbi:MAG TPA: efflux RND transporter periplasmic adaptor subunit [Dehalococcoidia bacterium]|nr:efflux RND transporter periplasmic adaptor subunit [Dehalococcoidia bacterium]
MKKRRILIITIPLVCIGIVLGIALTRGTGSQATPTTVNVTRGDIVNTVLVDGHLEMPNKAYLSFDVTGTVTEVLVSEGDSVTKGQVLARLDAQSLNSSVEVAELQVKIAQEQVEAAQAQYEIAQINLDKGVPAESEDVLEQQVDIAEANWETAELNLETANLNLDSAQLNLDKAVIVAPFDGIVADISITEGEEISTAALATPAITMVDTSEIEMQGYIDELDVASVKLGQAANITLDALPNEQVTGNVTFISPISTVQAGIVSYATTITLENPSAELQDGMSATAEIVVERRDNVLLIPNTVIQGTLENPMVVVLVDKQEEEREITLGLSDGINTEVLSGLEDGDRVVLPTTTTTGTQTGGLFGRLG